MGDRIIFPLVQADFGIAASDFDKRKWHHDSALRWLDRQLTSRVVDRREGQ